MSKISKTSFFGPATKNTTDEQDVQVISDFFVTAKIRNHFNCTGKLTVPKKLREHLRFDVELEKEFVLDKLGLISDEDYTSNTYEMNIDVENYILNMREHEFVRLIGYYFKHACETSITIGPYKGKLKDVLRRVGKESVAKRLYFLDIVENNLDTLTVLLPEIVVGDFEKNILTDDVLYVKDKVTFSDEEILIKAMYSALHVKYYINKELRNAVIKLVSQEYGPNGMDLQVEKEYNEMQKMLAKVAIASETKVVDILTACGLKYIDYRQIENNLALCQSADNQIYVFNCNSKDERDFIKVTENQYGLLWNKEVLEDMTWEKVDLETGEEDIARLPISQDKYIYQWLNMERTPVPPNIFGGK